MLSGQNEELKKHRTLLEHKCDELENKCAGLEAAQKKAQSAKDLLEQQLQKSQSEASQLQSSAQEVSAKLSAEEATVLRLQNLNDQLEASQRDLAGKLSGAEASKYQLENRRRDADSKIILELEGKVHDLTDELRDSKERERRLNSEVRSCKDGANQLHSTVEALEQELSDARAKSSSHPSPSSFERQLQELRAELTQLKIHRDKANNELADCQIEKKKVELDLEALASESTREQKTLRLEIEHLRTQCVALESKLTAQPKPHMHDELTNAQAETEAQMNVVQELEQRLADTLQG